MYKKTVLDNGVRVITSTMPHSRSVCVAFLIGAGSCYENEDEAGVSHFAEHLFFKGTQRRPTSKEISQDIEGVGGIINASTDKEVTVFWSKVAGAQFPLAVDVLSDLLLHSRFDGQDIEQERRIITEEINMNLDIPQQRVNMLIDDLLWPGQSLGREVAGSKQTVAALTREQILTYLAHHYISSNIVISVAGNIEHENVLTQVEPLFEKWADGKRSSYMTNDKQGKARLHVERKECEQTHLCLGVHGFSNSHPKRFVLDLLSTALGAGMSSRLFMEIRERKGLAYDIHSCTDHFLNSGSFIIYAGVDTRKVETAVAAILEEFFNLKQGITPSEITRAKELCKGRLELRLEDSQNLALWLGSQEILRQHILTLDEIIAVIDAITADELKNVAEEVINSGRLNLAIVGPLESDTDLPKLLGI